MSKTNSGTAMFVFQLGYVSEEHVFKVQVIPQGQQIGQRNGHFSENRCCVRFQKILLKRANLRILNMPYHRAVLVQYRSHYAHNVFLYFRVDQMPQVYTTILPSSRMSRLCLKTWSWSLTVWNTNISDSLRHTLETDLRAYRVCESSSRSFLNVSHRIVTHALQLPYKFQDHTKDYKQQSKQTSLWFGRRRACGWPKWAEPMRQVSRAASSSELESNLVQLLVVDSCTASYCNRCPIFIYLVGLKLLQK